MDYPIINLSCQFFMTLFTMCLPEPESLKVLDLFLLQGMMYNKLLFDVTLAYLRIVEKQILECSNVTQVIEPSNPIFNDQTLLMTEVRRARQQIKQQHIDFYRPVCHKEVLDDLSRQIQNNLSLIQERRQDPKQRQKQFLKHFKMFQGQTEREMLNQANLNPKDFFSCNHKWPVCRFNFAKEHTIVEEFVFKVESLSDVEIFHDYFDANKFEKRMSRKPPATTVKNLLLERGQHYCRIRDFTPNFVAMFTSDDEQT